MIGRMIAPAAADDVAAPTSAKVRKRRFQMIDDNRGFVRSCSMLEACGWVGRISRFLPAYRAA